MGAMTQPFTDDSHPAEPYPGARPGHCFVHLDGAGWPVTPDPGADSGWRVAPEGQDLDDWLAGQGLTLLLAELKGPVKDSLERYGMAGRFGPERFPPTVGAAVDAVTGRLREDIDQAPEERTDLRGEPG